MITRHGRLCGLLLAAGLLAAPLAVAPTTGATAAESITLVPPPAPDLVPDPAPAPGSPSQTVVLAGGCFWGVEAVYRHVPGVLTAVSGYAGGTAASAHYDQVSSGTTGHAEAVEVTFDPARVSLGTLLQLFFSVVHDPTQVDRQGNDVGPQYRSAIFVTSEPQRQLAEAYRRQLAAAKVFARPLATRIESLVQFYPAEDYHQNFAAKHPEHPYIWHVDRPKVEALKRLLPQYYRD